MTVTTYLAVFREGGPDRRPLRGLLCWREHDQSDANNNEGRYVTLRCPRSLAFWNACTAS
jgi:hypothetical protein